MNKIKIVSVTEEQIVAIGALTSLGEAMGHDKMTKLAREFLEEAGHVEAHGDKPIAIVATFDEFVQYGVEFAEHLVDGVPWSFTFNGAPVTHENDDAYIVGSAESNVTFHRGELLMMTWIGGRLLIQTFTPRD